MADVLPVVIGRLSSQPRPPRACPLQARYVTDTVSVLALCLGLAFLPLAGEEAASASGPCGQTGRGGGGGGGEGEGEGRGRSHRDEDHLRDGVPGRGTGSAGPARGAAPPRSGRVPPARTPFWLLLALFLARSFSSLRTPDGITSTQAARSYIATARIAVAKAPPDALIVDGPTPAFIMDPYLFYPTGYTSRVIGAIARGYPAKHLAWTTSPPGGIAPGP